MVKEAIQKQIEILEYRERKIFWLLFSIFVFFVVSYGFLLNSTIMSAVSKQKMEREILSMSSDVNSMEFQYLTIKNGITLSLAHSKGFVSVQSDKFASINPTQKNISLSINEN